jgi:ABC-type dipeptide/oligopeptide/nickel transport system permease subunit
LCGSVYGYCAPSVGQSSDVADTTGAELVDDEVSLLEEVVVVMVVSGTDELELDVVVAVVVSVVLVVVVVVLVVLVVVVVGVVVCRIILGC